MVEELIAEGMPPEEVVVYLQEHFRMSEPDARMLMLTAQGFPGDVLEVVEDAEYDDDVDELDDDLVAAAFVESKHRRWEAGRREGGRFAPKDGTSSVDAQVQVEAAVEDAQAADEMSTEEMRRNEVMKYAVANGVAETPPAQPGEVGNVTRMNVAATNPVYKGVLDGQEVVVKPQSSLSATLLREHVEPGFDLEREQAAAHVGSLLREDSPEVTPNVLSYQVKDVPPFGPAGVTPFVNGQTVALLDTTFPDRVGKVIAPDVRKIRLYDGIIGNTDRHTGNMMVSYPSSTVYAIDHGLAFPDENSEGWPTLEGGPMVTTLEPSEIGALERLRPRLAADTVLPTLLTAQQIRAMDDRIGFMLHNKRLINTTDWENGLVDDAKS